MADVVFSLRDPISHNPSLAGAKGATLAQMAEAGFPVPAGFIVSTQAFQTVADKIASAIDTIKDPNASETARKIIDSTDLPNETIAQIEEAYISLGTPNVSVRSSSTAEDLDQTSFAGQYDSFLNVCGIDDVIQRLKQVWASLYSQHALEYRRRNGFATHNVSMAVLIQQQLVPNAAGVLFTRDPLSGEEHYVVSAALGLGEGVVSGAAQSDRFVLQPETKALQLSDIATKEHKVVCIDGGGIKTISVDRAERDQPALTENQLTELADLGKWLVDLFGSPQDIEFAVTEDALHILQSRPMTAVEPPIGPDEPWEKSLDTNHCWRRRGGPLYRLEEDYSRARQHHMRDCFEETGSSMSSNHISHFTNGYMYVRPEEISEDELARRHALQTERIDACLERGKSYFEGALRSIVEDRLAELRKKRAAVSDFPDLVDYLEACIQVCGYVQGNLHWRHGRPSSHKDWPTEFHELTGAPPQEINVFVQAVQNRMTRLITRIKTLARIVQEDPILTECFKEKRFDALSSPKIKKRPNGKRFWSKFKAMLRVYGLRAGHGYGSSSRLATPTWNMDHTVPFELIASYAEQDLDRLDRLEHQARSERINAIRRIRRQLAKDPEKRDRFNRGLMIATLGIRSLEDHNYYMEQCTFGTMREAMFEVGQQLVQKNLVDTPDDVFHFSLEELKELALDKNPADQRERVRERIEELERRKKMKPPNTLGAEPEAPKSQNEGDKEEGERLEDNAIKGASASRGYAAGKAVIALPNRERPRVHPGDILVAPNVGPEWTPTFAILGGLVLDSGSLSQHAAIIAREYRIPAVMQTKNASKTITDGQHVAVDGDNGIVELAP